MKGALLIQPTTSLALRDCVGCDPADQTNGLGHRPGGWAPSLVRLASSVTQLGETCSSACSQAAAASLYRLGARGPVPVTPSEGRTHSPISFFPVQSVLFSSQHISSFFIRCNIAAQTGWRMKRGPGLRRLARDTRDTWEQARDPACQTP